MRFHSWSKAEDCSGEILRDAGNQAVAPRPDPLDVTGDIVRILGVERLQDEKGPRVPRLDEVLVGLWAVGRPLVFALVRRDEELAVALGFSSGTGRGRSLKALLHAGLPGAQLAPYTAGPIVDAVRAWPFGVSFAGAPTLKRAHALSAFVRGMPSEGWMYLVLAVPIPVEEIRHTISSLAEGIRVATNLHLRPGTVEASNHPLAKLHHELRVRSLRQWESGAKVGMWRTQGFLFAQDQETVDEGKALLVSVLRGKDSVPQPLQLIPCAGPHEDPDEPHVLVCELSSSELATFVALPEEEAPGFALYPRRSFSQALLATTRSPVLLGHLLTPVGPQPNRVCVEKDHILRHVFITGLTGSGKSHTSKHLLAQLWKDHGVPFMVIEPAKREYRRLVSTDGLDPWVFTLGDERECPFRINPFEVPEGVPVQTHIDLLRALFQATFAGLYPPMPYLLEQALLDVYEARGWDLTQDVGGGGRSVPTLRDLCSRACDVAEQAGYDPQVTQNVRTALRVRLGSMLVGAKARMLDTDEPLPMGELLSRPTVLELSAIGDPDLVAFLMGLLLIRVWEHCVWARGECSHLRHVTLVEEAHRLLAQQSAVAHPDVASVRAQAVEVFCQLLTEVRAYGEGIVVVDQSPAKLHPDVLRGTSLKIAHRLSAEDDRRAVGGCMSMRPDQVSALASLGVGEAVVFGEGMHEPILVQVPAQLPWDLSSPDSLRLSSRMRSFYDRFPGWLVSRGRGDGAVDRRAEFAGLLSRVETVLLEAPPAEMWAQLAEILVEAVRGEGGEDEVPLRALALGLSLAERLELPVDLRLKLARNLACALSAEEAG